MLTLFVVGDWAAYVERANVLDCWRKESSWRPAELNAVGCIHVWSPATKYSGDICRWVLTMQFYDCLLTVRLVGYMPLTLDENCAMFAKHLCIVYSLFCVSAAVMCDWSLLLVTFLAPFHQFPVVVEQTGAVCEILRKHYSHLMSVCLYESRKNCKTWASVIHKCRRSWPACQLKTKLEFLPVQFFLLLLRVGSMTVFVDQCF